jgi:hypothetical protein|tara:strand:- start:535 stop:804 length:270 start_codon:yes stop_codon:yes gene_type:complete
MTDENNQEVQEETVRFSDDGPEYKVSDLSDEAVLILNKCKMHQEQKNRYIQEANLNVEQMDILIGYYSDQLKAAVESEAEVVEVEDESS